MKLGDAALRAGYREDTKRGRLQDCPESGTLASTAAGKLAAADREAIAWHLTFCSDCSLEMQLARPLASTETGSAGPGRNWRLVLPLAAAFVLAAGIGILTRSASHSEPPAGVRGAAASGERTVPPDGATLAEPPAQLSWKSAPPADTFEIVLFDAESTEIWRSAPTGAPTASLPAGARAALPSGSPVYWRVLAVRGVERSTSPLFRFEVARVQ